MSTTNEKILTAYFDAIDSQDLDRLRHFVHDDIVYEDKVLKETFNGPEAILALWDTWYKHTRFGARIDEMIVQDDRYAIVCTMYGEYIKEIPGFGPASGQSYEFQVVSIGRLRDGKIVHNSDFWNKSDFLAALGNLD